MIVSVKDSFKMIGIVIVTFCAVFVCTLFLNWRLDLIGLEEQIADGYVRIMYDAQIMTANMVSALSGGSLLLTTVVLLCFYIKHYIDTHKKELGILKALGYSNMRIATGFSMFGFSVFAGTALGYIGAHCLMPAFYEVQNDEGILPDFTIHFHIGLFAALVILPTVAFAALSILYGCRKLRMPAMSLLREKPLSKIKKGKENPEDSFLQELRKSTVRQRKSLVFFITFATFCFAAMMQMSFSMDELASVMMSIMIMLIGVVLACVTLFIATTSVMKANGKTITMMKVFGYDAGDCRKSVLGGYRPWAYLGFVLGTGYQYGILKFAVSIVFRDVENVPEYGFDVPAMLITLAVFVVLYEAIMYGYGRSMEKLSVKEIMLE